MNAFSAVLFIHLLGAVALFIGYGIEWTASALFRNAAFIEQLRSWLRVFKVSPPLSGAGLGILLLSGGYLASLSGAMKQGWIPATLIGIFFALLLGFALILPRMKRIRAALPSGAGANEPLSPFWLSSSSLIGSRCSSRNTAPMDSRCTWRSP